MVSEASEPGSESGKRRDDRRGAARGTRAGSWSPQEGGASNHLAARLPPRAPGSFAAAAIVYPDSPLGAREGERRAAEQPSLPRLVLAPDLALDAALAALVGDARHAPPAGDDVARPGELREARLEPADRAHAARLHQELGEIPHREHPVREDAGVAGVARELVVGVHGVGITRRGGIRLQVLAGDRTLHERRQLLPHGDGLGVEAGNHVLREMSVLREKKTGSPAASTASVSSTAKSSMPFEPGFS